MKLSKFFLCLSQLTLLTVTSERQSSFYNSFPCSYAMAGCTLIAWFPSELLEPLPWLFWVEFSHHRPLQHGEFLIKLC